MKKIFAVILSFFVIISINSNIFAEGKTIKVTYNYQELTFDQPPLIEEGRTLVPFRTILEQMGAIVEWDQKNKVVKAQKEGRIIYLKINEKIAEVNSEKIELDVPAKIVNNRTLVPLRFIAENFGAQVTWNADKRQVDILYLVDPNISPMQGIPGNDPYLNLQSPGMNSIQGIPVGDPFLEGQSPEIMDNSEK